MSKPLISSAPLFPHMCSVPDRVVLLDTLTTYTELIERSQAELARRMVKAYEAGLSTRAIAAATHMSESKARYVIKAHASAASTNHPRDTHPH